MKKMLFLLFVLSLVGCQTTTTSTKTTASTTTQSTTTTIQTTTVEMLYPSGIRYEEETRILSWDAMSSATGYLLTINGTPRLLEETFLSLGFLSPGVYVFNLRTVYTTGQSEASIDFEITINTIKTFSGVYFQEDVISFLPFDGDVTIILEVFSGDEIIGVLLTSTEVDLSPYYYLTDSFRFVAFENDEEIDGFAFQIKDPITFDRLQVDDFAIPEIDLFSVIRLNQILLEESAYQWNASTKTLILDTLTMEELPLGTYILEVVGVQTTYIEIELKESRKPELVGESLKAYTNQNITFTFALYGGIFEGLQGVGITSSDYTFDGQTVTIQSTFLESVKTNNPTINQIMLSYSLYNHPHSVIGYLIIQIRPTN